MNPSSPAEISLARLRPGQGGVVRRVQARPDVHRRLLEMGLVPGTEIRVQKFAPLGDPMELIVGRYHLSLRREEASGVFLEAAGVPA